MLKLISPGDGAIFSVLTDVAREFIRRQEAGEIDGSDGPHEWDSAEYGWLPPERDLKRDLTYPAAVTFRWKTDGHALPIMFDIFDAGDPSRRTGVTVGRIECSAEDGEYFATAVNFIPGKKYVWRVSAGDETVERAFSFREGEIRMIEIDGTANVRDAGGYMTTSGRRIKYGMIYRGGAIDNYVEPQYLLTEKGKDAFIRDLGIRTDLDLRDDAEEQHFSRSYAGDEVNYLVSQINYYAETIDEKGREYLKKIFEIFCEPANYPLYIHCQAGADRTGVVMFYLQGLLGVPDETIMLDYNISSLSIEDERDWYGHPMMPEFLERISKISPAPTLSESLGNYLYTLGIPAEKLDRLRDFLLE